MTEHNSFFGTRKIKSIIAVSICFLMWQILRIFIPNLDVHPMYAYLYAIIEMRNSIEKMKSTVRERVIVSIIGIILALSAIALMDLVRSFGVTDFAYITIEFAVIVVGVLLALNVAEKAKCNLLCAMAATTFLICFIFHADADRYIYASLRFLQTLFGMSIAFLVNCTILKPKN